MGHIQTRMSKGEYHWLSYVHSSVTLPCTTESLEVQQSQDTLGIAEHYLRSTSLACATYTNRYLKNHGPDEGYS